MLRQIRKLQIGAWAFVLLGVGTFGLAGMALLKEMHGAAEREAAFAVGQPAPIAIEALDPATSLNTQNEVHVIGQLDVSMQYDLMAPSENGDHLGVMIPLYPVSAGDVLVAARAVLLYEQGPGGKSIGDTEINTLVAQIEGDGPVGPMITLGGLLLGGTRFDNLIIDSFADAGRPLAADFLVIAPFRSTRAAALAIGPDLEGVIKLGFIAAVFTLLGMTIVAFARNRNRKPRNAAQEASNEEAGAAHDPFADYQSEVNPANGAVIIPTYSPDMADGSSGITLMREVLALGRPGEETSTYTARRDGIDDFAALDSGGLKRPLPGRGLPEKLAGPKPVKKESPLAAKQDPTAAANIMAAVQAEISHTGSVSRRSNGAGDDIFAAVQAAVANQPAKKPMAHINPAIAAAQNPFGK